MQRDQNARRSDRLKRRGDSLAAENRYPEALRHYEKASSLLPGNPFLHLMLGQMLFELGNMERAAQELARAYVASGREVLGTGDPKYMKHVESLLEPLL